MGKRRVEEDTADGPDVMVKRGRAAPRLSVHVGKRKSRTGDAVVFDRSDRIEYVTGFSKRKTQRRKKAEKQLEQKARLQRNEDRKTVRGGEGKGCRKNREFTHSTSGM